MFKYLSLFLISCMIGISWNNTALAQQSGIEKDNCCKPTDPNCMCPQSAINDSDFEIIRTTQLCCEEHGLVWKDGVCCDGAYPYALNEMNESCCTSAGGTMVSSGGHGIDWYCCKNGSSKDLDGNFNQFCCSTAGGTAISGDVCCKSWSTALKSGSSSPMCTK